MRGIPTRLPYWPQLMRPIDLPPSRSSLVSWSESNDSATAHRAPSFHADGRRRRPARTCSTSLRQCGSVHCQGSKFSSSFIFIQTELQRKSAKGAKVARETKAQRDSSAELQWFSSGCRHLERV